MGLFYQCLLSKPSGDTTMGWIEERGAIKGASVELKTADGEFWNVSEVYQPPMEEAALRAKQANDRNALPSLSR